MKRLVLLSAALVGLAGCVSDYPDYGYDPYPDVYVSAPVYAEPYRAGPIYRDYGPYGDDRRYASYPRYRAYPTYPDDRGFRNYGRPYPVNPRLDDRPQYRPAPRPALVQRPDDAPVATRPVQRADRTPRTGEQPSIDAGRAFGGRIVAAPDRRGPRPYIPPIPAN